MKAINSTFLASLIITATCARAGGQSAANNINPALFYDQAFLVAPDISEADHDYLVYNEWRGQHLPDRFGQIVAQYGNEFKLLREAARSAAPCDWGIDMSDGPAALLTHIARTKGAVLTARFRALWDLQQSRQAHARNELRAEQSASRGSILPEWLNWRVAVPTIGAAALVIRALALFLPPQQGGSPPIEARRPVVASPVAKVDLSPTVANYQRAALRSLDDLDDLPTRQS